MQYLTRFMSTHLSREELDRRHESQISLLSETDRALYDTIVEGLMEAYSKRVVHPDFAQSSSGSPPVCAVVFRQSKSWSYVQNKLNAISQEDKEIKKWVKGWNERINCMRISQGTIHHLVGLIQEKEREIALLNGSMVVSNDRLKIKKIFTIKAQITELKEVIWKQRLQIKVCLTQGQISVDRLLSDNNTLKEKEIRIIEHPDCQVLLNYLKTYWFHLQVFSDWPEVSLDQEILATHVQRFQGQEQKTADILLSELFNRSTKGVFLFREAESRESPITFNHFEPGTVIHPTKIKLEGERFAPESPAQRHTPSLVSPLDDITARKTTLPPVDLASQVTLLNQGSMAQKAGKITHLALSKINATLSKEGHATDTSYADSSDLDHSRPNLKNLLWFLPFNDTADSDTQTT